MPPRIWLLQSEKAGDNAQMEVVAEALGWPVERRRVAVQERWRFRKPRVRPSLGHVDLARSDPLEPPWPDAILTVGRRMSSVALWIRQQSGGHTKVVLLGKPRQRLRDFDLAVVSSQYRMPDAPNVLRLAFPLIRLDTARLDQAAEAWRERLGALPRPLTALLVGGPVQAVTFDAAVARRLAHECRALLEREGGSLYATTSRRTPGAVAEALERELPPGALLHRWGPDAADNPYLALLALADRFVVTSDSITMMLEVARLAKPLAVFELPPAGSAWRRRLARGRDLGALPRRLMAEGHAVRLGEPFSTPPGPPEDELERVAEHIRGLWALKQRE